MYSVIAGFISEGLKHRRAVKDIMGLCDVFGLVSKDTRIWAELNSMYSPVIPTSEGESAFAEAYLMKERESRCWGYLRYMVTEGDVTIDQIKRALEVFSTLEKLVDILGMTYLSVITKMPPEDWWKDEASGSCIAN